MTGLTRRHVLAGGCACSALALAGCQTTSTPAEPVAAGYKPSMATDEGGLWQAMDKSEADLKRSRALMADPELTGYVRDLACRMTADRCPDLRVYVLRTPFFNASMAPNGMMQVWSGLLLRTRNEAQLAAVLGHEIGHYLQRHSLQRFRDMKARADAATFLTLGLAAAGAGAGGALVNLAMVAGAYSFSREQEREADDIGLSLMAKAGFAPIEASKVWEQLAAEDAAVPDRKERSVLFATHPSSEERMATLRDKAAALAAPGQTTGEERFRARMRGIRKALFEDELRLRQYERTLVLLDRLQSDLPGDADVMHFHGELYRTRQKDGDLKLARGWYERAVATGQAPAEAWRGLGLTQRADGAPQEAAASFRRYLAAAPAAPDRDLIQSYIATTLGS